MVSRLGERGAEGNQGSMDPGEDQRPQVVRGTARRVEARGEPVAGGLDLLSRTAADLPAGVLHPASHADLLLACLVQGQGTQEGLCGPKQDPEGQEDRSEGHGTQANQLFL